MVKTFYLIVLIVIVGCTTVQKTRTLSVTTDWSRNTLSKDYMGTRLFQNMTPLVTEDFVYEGNGYDGFSAYTRKGNLRWKRSVKNGASSGAAILADRLFFGGSDGQFNCVNKFSGDLIWSFPTQTETLSAPTVEGASVYFITSNGVLYSLDTGTGKVKWSYNRREKTLFTIRSNSTPVIDGSLIYSGFSDGYLVALNKADGTLKWEKQLNTDARFRDVNASPVIEGSTLYVSSYDGALYALDKTTGKTIWTFENGGSVAVTIQDKRIFFASSNGHLYALDKSTGKEIWNYKNSGGVATQPSYYKELLIFGESSGALTVVQALDGKFVSKFTTGWGITARPVVDSDHVYVMSNYGNLYAFNLKWTGLDNEWPWEFKKQ